MEQSNYRAEFEPKAEKFYVKKFRKLYKAKWNVTERTILDVCRRIDNMLQYNRADLILSVGFYKLVKLDFAVIGTHMSPKSSGNRCILFVDEDMRAVKVLLVYSKNDVASSNETQWWKTLVKNEYEDIGKIFDL